MLTCLGKDAEYVTLIEDNDTGAFEKRIERSFGVRSEYFVWTTYAFHNADVRICNAVLVFYLSVSILWIALRQRPFGICTWALEYAFTIPAILKHDTGSGIGDRQPYMSHATFARP